MEIRNQLAVCPYDHNHLVKKGRIQQHLIKCRQNHLHEEFKICPFNACHRFHPAEFQSHLNSCPDKECLEREIYNRAKEQSGKYKSGNLNVPIFNNEPPPCTEDWDLEDDVQEDIKEEIKEKLQAVTPPQEPEALEEIPPIQPRVLHTAVVSAMKKQNHEGKGLRPPKHLPKALGQHWPRHGSLLQNSENPDQEHPPDTMPETTQGTVSNVPAQTTMCIEPSHQTTHRTLLSELTSICDRITPLSSEISDSTSSTQALPSQKTTPNKTLTLQCAALDTPKPSQTTPGDIVPLSPISPLTQKMRSLGRGMLFKFQVNNSQLTGTVGTVLGGSAQTRSGHLVKDTDPTGRNKHPNCQQQLTEDSTDSPASSDTKRETKKDSTSNHLQPASGQNALCDEKLDPPPLGRGRGILALKFLQQRNKSQEPSVGNRATSSDSVHHKTHPQ